jgi:hypothetical protein
VPADLRIPYRLAPTRWERRRLVECDRHAARLADLHLIECVLRDAGAVVAAGWIQHGWLRYRDPSGQEHTTGDRTVHLAEGRPITAACLVGAVLHAAGGLAQANAQPMHRALELCWHVLYRSDHEPVRWCPAPTTRLDHVRDLTRWNDHPDRAASDVTGLLATARRRAGVELSHV